MALTVYSIGHSNRPLEEFLTLIAAHGVRTIADVRSYATSRRWPHFDRGALSVSLEQPGIAYHWLPALGGRRPRKRDVQSVHTAWTVAGFRNYADYTDTEEFAAGLQQLVTLATAQPTAFMCAEALYWRCHRRLIADRLTFSGYHVLHIESPTRAVPHQLPDFVRVVEGRLIYNGGTQLAMLGG